MKMYKPVENYTMDDIREADKIARNAVVEQIGG